MGNKEGFCLQTQTWGRESHGLFDYEFKNWYTEDFELKDESKIIFRLQDNILIVPNFTKLKEAKSKVMSLFSNSKKQDEVIFSVLGFLTKDKNGYKMSSVNHYSTYFKHKELLKEKFETFKYEQYGNHGDLKSVGVDGYCKDIWKIARDPRTMHSLKFKSKDKHSYLGEELQQGDIIKIGRIKLKLKKFGFGTNLNPFSVIPSSAKHKAIAKERERESVRHSALINRNYKKEVCVEKNEEIPPGRFGLSNEMDDNTNPLINPCDCKGTMGFLHIEGMKQWLDTK